MKWTNVIHVLIDKVDRLVKVLSQLYLLLQVLVKLLAQRSASGAVRVDEGANVADPVGSAEKGYLEEELVTVKAAMGILNVSRWKIEDFVHKRQLTKIGKTTGGIRLILAEVEQLRYSYSVKKGKI